MSNNRRKNPPPEPGTLTTPAPAIEAPPGLTAKAIIEAAVQLPDEDKRDLLQTVLETLATEEPTVEDIEDIKADAESWRSQQPEVFALAIVAKVVGRTITVKDIDAELIGYTAGHTPAKQHAIKQRLRLALSTIVEVGQQAGRRLNG